MVESKSKTKTKWKELIRNSLNPEEFQDLCGDIINSTGEFKNIQFRGRGGDGGRDFEAGYIYTVAKENITEKCWFQCKRQKEGVNFKQLSTEILKAENQNVTKFFIMSNADTTATCKDDIKNWNNKQKCQVFDWSGTKFIELLGYAPNVCNGYFPDEEVPFVSDIKNPREILKKSSDLGKRFGIELSFKFNKKIDLNNPSDVANVLKDALLKLQDIDINLKALIYQKISMFFFSVEKTEDALMFLNKSLEISPKNVEALLNKGSILEKINDVEESNKCYDIILDIDSNNKFALNNKAHNLRRGGQYNEALVLVNKVLDADPKFIVAILTKVETLKGQKKLKEALIYLEEKKTFLEKSVNLQEQKVLIYIEMLDFKKAYEINEEILKTNPDNVNAINNKGVIFENNAKFQNPEKYLSLAFECFEKAIKSDNNSPIYWSNKAAIFINRQQIDEAEKIINISYNNFPKNAHVLNKKGVLLRIKGKERQALKYFDKALNLLYNEPFLLDYAKTQLLLKQWKNAINNAEKVLRFNSKNSTAWAIKGEALRHLREHTKSKMCFKNAEKFEEKPISLLE